MSRKILLIGAGFLLLLAVATIGVLRLLDQKSESGASSSGNQSGGSESSGALLENDVSYTDEGFSPATISVGVERGLGCIVRVVNRSKHAVKLGVSPHKAAGDPGPDYSPIKPRESFLFDPRFPGFAELGFHDHGRPELQFLVKFEKSCQ